jgi:hypothetical protein
VALVAAASVLPLSAVAAAPAAASAAAAAVASPAVALSAPAAFPATVAGSAGERGNPYLASQIVTPPRPVPGTDRRVHLAYEILLQNTSDQPVRVDRVEVRSPARPRPVAVYDGAALERLLFNAETGGFTGTLGPGAVGVLILDVTLRHGGRVPASLVHRLSLTVPPDTVRPVTVTVAPTRVDRREPVRLRPPLRGSDLAVFGCCGPPFAHRLALLELNGRLVLAQRYAIDFVQLDNGLNSFAGDPSRNENYFVFGDDVLAVAPGRVVATRDGVPENVPPNLPPSPGLDDLTGNFVIQDIGGGNFALYAHLQTGSVRVRPGDRLQRGVALGRVGNTGNSSEPHLHFQVTDGAGLPSGLDANGVPYVFDRFRFDSRVAGLDAVPPTPVRVPAPPPHRRAQQYPLTGDIVGFR